MLPEPKRRIRWLTHEEAQRLIDELPEHLAEMVRFTLATGLRKANVTGWSGHRWIFSDASPGYTRIRPRHARRSGFR